MKLELAGCTSTSMFAAVSASGVPNALRNALSGSTAVGSLWLMRRRGVIVAFLVMSDSTAREQSSSCTAAN